MNYNVACSLVNYWSADVYNIWPFLAVVFFLNSCFKLKDYKYYGRGSYFLLSYPIMFLLVVVPITLIYHCPCGCHYSSSLPPTPTPVWVYLNVCTVKYTELGKKWVFPNKSKKEDIGTHWICTVANSFGVKLVREYLNLF